jgi:hypothetical protein
MDPDNIGNLEYRLEADSFLSDEPSDSLVGSLRAVSNATYRFDIFLLESNLITFNFESPSAIVAIAGERNRWSYFVKSVVVSILDQFEKKVCFFLVELI